MVVKRMAVGAVVAALSLSGLVAAGATPAFAGVPTSTAKCDSARALEAVLVHVTENNSASPPRTVQQRKDEVVGQLQRGQSACTTDRGPAEGKSYEAGGRCLVENSDLWVQIRFNGNVGWVAASCVDLLAG